MDQKKNSNRPYDSIIFDLDGTLLNTLHDLRDAVNHVLENHGYPSRRLEEIRGFVGNGIYQLMMRAVPKNTLEHDLNLAFQEFKEYYTSHCRVKTKPYEGVLELLQYLKDNGYKTAIVSNKNDAAVKELVQIYFKGLIDVSLGQREGIRIKPASDAVIEAMKLLGTDATKALYVGDSEVDMETAKNAAMDYVLVDWGFRHRDQLEELNPMKIISQSHQLIQYLTDK